MQLVDTHCHLDYDYEGKTEADLIREARAAGVQSLVTIGVDMSSLEKVKAISDRNDNVFHTVGVHPHEAITLKEGDIGRLRQAASHPKCRGIGEIGLDYHYDHSPRETQKQALEQQLDLARELALPVIIHSREAEEDLLEALTRYAKSLPEGAIPGIIHCFSGTKAFGEACLRLGFYISFSGIITFKKSDDLRECVKTYPLERILVETDSPYLAPVPYRGKKCEPSMVRKTAEKVAEIKGLSLEQVAEATTRNAKAVFRL